MIKLELPPKPSVLILKGDELTEKFKIDGKDVWNRPEIKRAVLEISYGKCSYSECMLNTNSSYMEIDHFYPKSLYPEKVLEWGNLLPSSKKCNGTKQSHDVNLLPIINPITDNPKDHLYISNFRYYAKTTIGQNTIKVVALNDRQHFVNNRARIGQYFAETLSDICEYMVEHTDDKGHIRTVNKLKKLLNEATRRNEYSATLSTLILCDENYQKIEHQLIENELWDSELAAQKKELDFCALPAL